MGLPNLRTIGFINGIFLLTLAVSMLVPVATLLIFEQPQLISGFLWSSLITGAAGLTLVGGGYAHNSQLRPRDMYMLTVSSWIVVGSFAALPFMFAGDSGVTDAFFESMSGITATGATVLVGLDSSSSITA